MGLAEAKILRATPWGRLAWLALLGIVHCGGGRGNGADIEDTRDSATTHSDIPVVTPEYGGPDLGPTDVGCADCDVQDLAGEPDPGAEVVPGQPGAPCKKNSDCDSEFCIETPDGRQCAQYCYAGEETCPPGYRCSQVQAYPDTVYVCVYLYPRLCRPCRADQDCLAAYAPGPALCVPADPEGRFCGSPCDGAQDCPPGYDCRLVTSLAGMEVRQCAPSDGPCTCSKTAVSEAASTPCTNENEHGRCPGERTCTPEGLSDCSAREPAPEVCNGQDDDCNGLTDDVPSMPCTLRNPYGQCPGMTTCRNGQEECAGTPAMQEVCNQVDDDCDGLTDEEGAIGCAVFYRDEDGDTYGTAADSRCLCAKATPYTATRGGDCDDSKPQVNPGATETCNGADDDCDAQTDEEDASGCAWFIKDGDQDGWGAGFGVDRKCLCAAAGLYTASKPGDCEDLKPAVHPGAGEVCNGLDDDCDGATDPQDTPGCVSYFVDVDGDQYGDPAKPSRCLCAPDLAQKYAALQGGDCNDSDASQSPSATEVCDGKDNDCDGQTDEQGAVGCVVRYRDEDGDQYGTGDPSCTCVEVPPVTALKPGDCDDTDSAVFPGATETCNGHDDDCDGLTDDENASGCHDFFLDEDGDGWGTSVKKCLCVAIGAFRALLPGDCDDEHADLNPGAFEQCGNAVDENCSGTTDEENGVGCEVLYYDQDDDGWGTSVKKCLCEAAGFFRAAVPGDCDDGQAAVHPGAPESCNGLDDDCDQAMDEEGALGCQTRYYDGDGDGYGVLAPAPRCLCGPDAPAKYTATVTGDCDDGKAAVNPRGAESCNGLDDDCDQATDEEGASGCRTRYYDGDGDGHGVLSPPPRCLCAPDAPGKYTAEVADDCNDLNPQVYPGATESCNGLEDDCDGQTDEENAAGCSAWYKDQDQDGYGTDDVRCLCGPDMAGRYSATGSGDCHDLDAAVHPGAAICGRDADCDESPLDVGEECDDGNSVSWDGCTVCQVTEARVNAQTSGNQNLPAVASLPSGGWVAVYQAYFSSPTSRKFDVAARLISNQGLPTGTTDIVVNTTVAADQTNPDVACFPGGKFVVVWQSDGQDGDLGGVVARVFDAAGDPLSGEVLVNTYTTGPQVFPRVTALPNGDYVVVWQSYGQDGDGNGVYGRRLSSSGAAPGAEFRVHATTGGDQSFPAVAHFSDNRLLVAWESPAATPGTTEIRWRFLSADGTPLTEEATANTPGTASCTRPDVAVFGDDRFVIAWERSEAGDNDAYARRFLANGTPDGIEFRLHQYALDSQLRPQLASLPDGRLVATWMSDGQDGSYLGAFARRFDALGSPIGAEFQVNVFTTGEQSFPAISAQTDGAAYVVWHSLGQDGSGYGVFGRLIAWP